MRKAVLSTTKTWFGGFGPIQFSYFPHIFFLKFSFSDFYFRSYAGESLRGEKKLTRLGRHIRSLSFTLIVDNFYTMKNWIIFSRCFTQPPPYICNYVHELYYLYVNFWANFEVSPFSLCICCCCCCWLMVVLGCEKIKNN